MRLSASLALPRSALLAALMAMAGLACPVPSRAATPAAPGAVASAPKPVDPAAAWAEKRKKRPPAAPVKLIDINSASRAQLKTLPGIGDAEADRLIAARPFLTKTELVTKNVIPTGPYIVLKDRVIAMQKTMPKAKP